MAAVYPPETNDDVATSWVPLTTTFTPSVGCESKFRLNGMSLVAYDPGYGLDIDSRVKCAPPAVTTWWEQGRLGRGNDAGHTAASLGPMICPNAWSTVATSVKGSSTQAMCCPPDFYLANAIRGSAVGDCQSDVSSGAVLTYASTPLESHDAWTIATTTLTSLSRVGAIAVVGWNIAMETTSSSTASSTASPTTSAPTSSSTSTVSSEPTSTDLGSGVVSGGAESSGLPTGAAIGIGVGVGLGVIGIAALIATIYLLRSRKRKANAAAAAAVVAPVTQPSESGGYLPPPKPAEGVLAELAASQRHHSYRPYELP
ncbi:hypothetical protein C8A00DRAFT_28598 [Chaetomidium leptoderma]|uniref:Uncharacterized protein n=1 Tax=Chaetomidium leptoderma TaxID=669021 RepID=A0AAN7A324_9PEZI|nr:hypothetical protein C8A00DRAFT_28598 [Chaetomidium leptoderma]